MDVLAGARDYLVKSQQPDGSWGSGDPFVCARAMLALKGYAPDGTLMSGLKYLESLQAPDGHFARKTNRYSDATNTAYPLIALNKFDYGKASMPVSRGILWLLENQNEDGSWGTSKLKKAYTTSFCLRALRTFYLSGINRYRRGLDFTLSYLEGLDFNKEPVSHVYAPILNLKVIGALDGALEDKFIAYAEAVIQHVVDGGRVADAAYVLAALKALGEPEMPPVIEEWLSATRNADGSFGTDLASPGDPNTTALVVLALTGKL